MAEFVNITRDSGNTLDQAERDEARAALAQANETITTLRGALVMAREELVFGGDWSTARSVADKALQKVREDGR